MKFGRAPTTIRIFTNHLDYALGWRGCPAFGCDYFGAGRVISEGCASTSVKGFLGAQAFFLSAAVVFSGFGGAQVSRAAASPPWMDAISEPPLGRDVVLAVCG